jgi:hypothetical protein
MVARARRISVILHRMSVDGTTFRLETAACDLIHNPLLA